MENERGRRVLAALVGIIALWALAACGDAEPDSVVTTVDGDVEIVEEPEDSIPIVGDNDGRGLDTVGPPDGLEAPPLDPAEPPAAEYSPSERQSRQELAVSEIEVLPEPADDTSAPEPFVDEAVETVEGSAIRPDLDQFPATIPVTVPGNDGTTTPQSSSTDAGAQPRVFDPNLFETAAEVEPAVATANDELGGVEPPEPVIETESDDEAAAPDGPTPADDCFGIEDCDSLVFGDDGLGVATGSDTGVDTDQPDCVERPWAKGCPGPAPDYKGSAAVDAQFADTAPDEKTEEGVYVPQEIQDALLAPVD